MSHRAVLLLVYASLMALALSRLQGLQDRPAPERAAPQAAAWQELRLEEASSDEVRARHGLAGGTLPALARAPGQPVESSLGSSQARAASLLFELQQIERARQLAAHNLCNALTPGFKALRLQDGALRIDMSQGQLLPTGQALDLAVEGPGLVRVDTRSGELRYLRLGRLQLDAAGKLCDQAGRRIQPTITLPRADLRSLSIDPDGRIHGVTHSSPDSVTDFGRLQLVVFPRPAQLRPCGHGSFAATEAAGTPNTGTPGTRGLGLVKAGYLEQSNSQPFAASRQLEALDARRVTLQARLQALEPGRSQQADEQQSQAALTPLPARALPLERPSNRVMVQSLMALDEILAGSAAAAPVLRPAAAPLGGCAAGSQALTIGPKSSDAAAIHTDFTRAGLRPLRDLIMRSLWH